MIAAKLTTKGQMTIPLPVRTHLGLREGDVLVFAIEGDRVVLTKAKPAPSDDPFATFGEWDSEADRRAYAKL
ncbi:MAG TPA: AbrB/MazE/SpoVT family DNA-binding domain-containing protein [Stellaceae bacterium]|nr:AbrB/MazE/SpoVT family DNA-binding domain-containing protein [Stellaceae bacterium]